MPGLPHRPNPCPAGGVLRLVSGCPEPTAEGRGPAAARRGDPGAAQGGTGKVEGGPVMDRRRFLLTSLAGALAEPLAGHAEQATKTHRIGMLGPSDAGTGTPYVDAFRQGMRELGWVEGKSFVIEYRWADGRPERLPTLAADLVRLQVDVILTGAATANRPAKDATKTIPIVMTTGSNPVETGLVVSLARPGGNITGLSNSVGPEIAG